MVDVDHAVLDSDKLSRLGAKRRGVVFTRMLSAGSDAPSCYAELLDPAGCYGDACRRREGEWKASRPLPRKLLGAEKPLRAFLGHVEPTFDWTLRDPETGQP